MLIGIDFFLLLEWFSPSYEEEKKIENHLDWTLIELKQKEQNTYGIECQWGVGKGSFSFMIKGRDVYYRVSQNDSDLNRTR